MSDETISRRQFFVDSWTGLLGGLAQFALSAGTVKELTVTGDVAGKEIECGTIRLHGSMTNCRITSMGNGPSVVIEKGSHDNRLFGNIFSLRDAS